MSRATTPSQSRTRGYGAAPSPAASFLRRDARSFEEQMPASPDVTREQVEFAKQYVIHRYRTGVNPVQGTIPPGMDDPMIRGHCERILSKEYDLLCVQMEHTEEDIRALKEVLESLRLGSARSKELIGVHNMKLQETERFSVELEQVLRRSQLNIPGNAALTMPAMAAELNEPTLLDKLTALLQEQESVLASAADKAESEADALSDAATREGMLSGATTSVGEPVGHQATSSPKASKQHAVAVEKANAQRALLGASRGCVTNRFSELIENASALVTTRRQLEYEREWSEQTLSELQRLQNQHDSARDGRHTLERTSSEAREALEEAHKNVFTMRKKFIITHKRLMGREALPNGETLRPGVCEDVVNRIRSELLAGETTTLMSLAESDCKQLEVYGDKAYGKDMYRTPRGNPGAAASQAWDQTASSMLN